MDPTPTAADLVHDWSAGTFTCPLCREVLHGRDRTDLCPTRVTRAITTARAEADAAGYARGRAEGLREALSVRPEVAAFALLMEAKLRKNDHRPGWKHEPSGWLLQRLDEEVAELRDAVTLRRGGEEIGKEAADVANFAMMIADVCGALAPHPEPTPGPRVPLTSCAAGSDGDCYHTECPQIRDGEPERSHRHCPLDTRGDDDV